MEHDPGSSYVVHIPAAPNQMSLASESTLSLVSSDGGFTELPELRTHFIPNSPTVFEEDEDEHEDGGDPPSEDNDVSNNRDEVEESLERFVVEAPDKEAPKDAIFKLTARKSLWIKRQNWADDSFPSDIVINLKKGSNKRRNPLVQRLIRAHKKLYRKYYGIRPDSTKDRSSFCQELFWIYIKKNELSNETALQAEILLRPAPFPVVETTSAMEMQPGTAVQPAIEPRPTFETSSIAPAVFELPSQSLPTKTECWELDDVFLLVSKVFKENELNCLWKAEMDSVLDQLIVRRVPSLQSLHAEIKQEQDISDIVGNQQSENYVREPDIFDLELDRKAGTKMKIDNSDSDEDLNFELIEKVENVEDAVDLIEGSDVNSLNPPKNSDARVDDKTSEPIVKEEKAHQKNSGPMQDDSLIKPKTNFRKRSRKELVKCKYCDKVFASRKFALRHETKIHLEKYVKTGSVTCHCGVTRHMIKWASIHETKEHKGESLATCKLCSGTFQNLKSAIQHCQKVHRKIDIVTNEPEKDEVEQEPKKDQVKDEIRERQCPICHTAFITRSRRLGEFRNHMLDHFNKEIICPICGKESSTHGNMEKHMTRIHLKKDPSNVNHFYKCTYCSHIDFSADKLAYHQEVKHDQEILHPRVFVCHCARAFTSQSILDWHVLIVHIKYDMTPETVQKSRESREKVSCEICGKPVAASGIKVHLRKHDGTAPKIQRQTCTDCGKTYYSAKGLKDHRMSTHLKIERKCPICGKVFLSHSGLQAHLVHTHSDKRHPCDLCGKSYSLKQNLGIHIRRVHKGQPARMYKCSFCPKEFNRPSLRAKHELKHSSLSETPD